MQIVIFKFKNGHFYENFWRIAAVDPVSWSIIHFILLIINNLLINQ